MAMLNNQRVEYTLIVSRIYGFLIFEQLTNGLLGKSGNLTSIFPSSDHGAFRFQFSNGRSCAEVSFWKPTRDLATKRMWDGLSMSSLGRHVVSYDQLR